MFSEVYISNFLRKLCTCHKGNESFSTLARCFDVTATELSDSRTLGNNVTSVCWINFTNVWTILCLISNCKEPRSRKDSRKNIGFKMLLRFSPSGKLHLKSNKSKEIFYCREMTFSHRAPPRLSWAGCDSNLPFDLTWKKVLFVLEICYFNFDLRSHFKLKFGPDDFEMLTDQLLIAWHF